MKDCERCKYSYVDETGAGVYLRCCLKKQCSTTSDESMKSTCSSCKKFEEKVDAKNSKGDDESILKLVFEKQLDVPQFLRSSCANGYNCYIRATYNWNKEIYEKFTLTDEEYEKIKKAFDTFKGGE